jgi:hypothetical protein
VSKLLKELNELSEMTQRVGGLEPMLLECFNKYSSELAKDSSKFKQEGKLADGQEVLHRLKQDRNREIYLVKQKDESIAYFAVQDDGQRPMLVEVYVKKEHRKTHIFTNFILYVIHDLKRSGVEMGASHSNDTVYMLKSLYKSKKFKMTWENADTGEKIKYDPATVDKFYQNHTASAWTVILE